MARDKPTNPLPRGKGQDGRSLTSNVTTTPYLYRHPYADEAKKQVVLGAT